MLMVIDRKTGKKVDVRTLMGIEPEEIKNEKLREEVGQIDIQAPEDNSGALN